MSEYSKIEIALEYLEASIAEREIHHRYFAAMNLAYVAEEIFGKAIRILGEEDQLTTTVDTLTEIQDKTWDILGWNKLNKKALKKLLSSAKNRIKHMDSISDLNAKLFFDVENESKWSIQAAIRNLDLLKIERSVEVQKFHENYAEKDETNSS